MINDNLEKILVDKNIEVDEFRLVATRDYWLRRCKNDIEILESGEFDIHNILFELENSKTWMFSQLSKETKDAIVKILLRESYDKIAKIEEGIKTIKAKYNIEGETNNG